MSKSDNLLSLTYQSILLNGYAVIPDSITKATLHHDFQLVDHFEKSILNRSCKANFILDDSKVSKYIYHLYSAPSDLKVWSIIKNNPMISQIIAKYFFRLPTNIQFEIFWRNPGGKPIQPHQDNSYSKVKQLSFVIPLSFISPHYSPLKYSPVSENTNLAHRFSFYNMAWYCIEMTSKNKFVMPYQSGDIIVHSEFSLHKASNPPSTAARITYARMLVSEIV